MKDLFSKQVEYYVNTRPQYPIELYEFLTKLCKEKKVVWDCATGNGQAALSLSYLFDKVHATDISTEQLAHAYYNNNIVYKTEGEHSSLESNSADLVTVATAVHWFDLDEFYSEAHRVLKKDGVLAVWTYDMPEITPEIDKIVHKFSDEILKDYWTEETKLSKNGYRSLYFPYKLISTPEFSAAGSYSCDDFMDFMHSWSSVQMYKDARREDPIELIASELRKAWGERKRLVTWKLYMKCGKKSS